MAPERVHDLDGHAWPHTGTWCAVCGWPLIRHHDDQTMHPLCEPETER